MIRQGNEEDYSNKARGMRRKAEEAGRGVKRQGLRDCGAQPMQPDVGDAHLPAGSSSGCMRSTHWPTPVADGR